MCNSKDIHGNSYIYLSYNYLSFSNVTISINLFVAAPVVAIPNYLSEFKSSKILTES